jgi:nickel transport protein
LNHEEHKEKYYFVLSIFRVFVIIFITSTGNNSKIMNNSLNFKFFPHLILVVLWLCASAGSAFAHKAIIFAWVEGDTVFTQSKFSRGRKAIDSIVVVYDTEGNQLLDGKTDKNGEFSFKVPKKSALKVVLKASMGHMAEWTIPAKEVLAAVGDIAHSPMENAPNKGSKETSKDPATVKTKTANSLPAHVYLERQALQQMIDKSLDKKLAPITNMLAKTMDREPGITEILGSIGYILGLVGIALYVSNRRRKD